MKLLTRFGEPMHDVHEHRQEDRADLNRQRLHAAAEGFERAFEGVEADLGLLGGGAGFVHVAREIGPTLIVVLKNTPAARTASVPKSCVSTPLTSPAGTPAFEHGLCARMSNSLGCRQTVPSGPKKSLR
jgi:hypothetical protein